MNLDSLPAAFIARLKQIVPAAQLPSVLDSYHRTKPTYFRINTLKANTNDVLAQLQAAQINYKADPTITNAYAIPAQQHALLSQHPAFLQAQLYIQSLPSMLAVIALDPQPGEEILDLAAAPGSKTTQMAALMHNQGRIAAVEKIKARYYKLKDNITHQGASCVQTYLKDGGIVFKSCENRFDRVLLDAPCSSEGRFDLNKPETLRYWSENKVKEMTRKQWRLIYSAFRSLKSGGTLVYSTCTLSSEENEQVIAKLFNKFPDAFCLQALPFFIDNTAPALKNALANIPGKEHACRLLPSTDMGGFFIARIHKY